MKLMKVVDKVIGSMTYFKFRINLPVKMVKDLGLEGKELRVTEKNGKIVIEKNDS